MSSSNSHIQSFVVPTEDIKYNGSNHGKMVIYFLAQMQICYPEIYLWLTTQLLPRDSPHHERCWFKVSAEPVEGDKVDSESPESPNAGIIMVNSDEPPSTSSSSSNSAAPPAVSNRRESGGHSLFGNLAGIDLDTDSTSGSAKPTHSAYFTNDPFGHERCRIKVSDARTVAEKELAFGSSMRSASACLVLCCTTSIKNKLMTNLDFKHASSVGRVDVMLLITRILDSNNFSSSLKKNMLNPFSFPILLEFLKVSQGGDSLSAYTKRFNDKLLGLNTLGAMLSDKDDVQLLLNNIWGQLFLHGMHDSYSRVKCNANEKEELDYPKPELEYVQTTARVWEESIIRRKKMMGGKSMDTRANAMDVDSDEDSHGHARSTKTSTKRSWTREEKDEQVKVAVAAARKTANARYDQLKATHQSKVKAMDTKKNAYCFLCGYNKGHQSHLCERIPTNLKADALKEFERQSAWLASNSKK
jgi:hypothetical protein